MSITTTAVDVNTYFDNLKKILKQYSFSKEQTLQEIYRLNRLKRITALKIDKIDKEVAVKNYALYSYGLILKMRASV